jgi:pyruvate,water dikinase
MEHHEGLATHEPGRSVTRTRQLFELSLDDSVSVSAKAANLGVLANRGLPVPPGVVVVATETDDGIGGAVAEALAVLGDGPLAVRSSALAEDLDGASFAGQYETVLDVRGADAVVEAVRRVRAAADDERVAIYRSTHGPAEVSGIGVLLMPMIAAEVSGVAFTAHPLTGAREETVVTATIDEIAGTESRNSSVSERRELWARNRRLTPPLVLGTMPKFVTKMHEDAIAKMTAPAVAGEGMLRGMPASSGRVTGVARVLFGLADADRLAPGEILVTTDTTPAWTPLFSRAAGIVTDGGSLVLTRRSSPANTGSRPWSLSATPRVACGMVNGSRSTAVPVCSSSSSDHPDGAIGTCRIGTSRAPGVPEER